MLGITALPLAALSLASPPPAPLNTDFHAAAFSAPMRIDNRWSPLVPGTQFTLVGRSNRGEGRVRHRVIFTVTDVTKVIDGVRTLVIWDRDINAGRLLEEELAFQAQDDAGTVWNVGEYPEVRRRGRLVGAPDTWISGLDGAAAGVLMPARPRAGTPSYRQGWAPAIEFADRARVLGAGRRACVPAGCYDHVLVTDEWNPTEHGAHERKYYARGVGNVRVGFAGGKERESLALRRVRRLGPAALARARARVLALDRRAYRVNARVYGRTLPAE
ncbi:hypothetical protein [Candidatus Solirubrobacter pratensis]|uniref:hypothetical protein n=1 Tax=Candidatus Solirubrobacter pratensis TaxID=1298857 RepID=UPI00040AF448|nr:hypothetical protein [Candidatus Solirubrobacter pratensis]